MSKKFGEHPNDKYIEKVAVGSYRLYYKSGGTLYRYSLESARSAAQSSWQYKEFKKKVAAPATTATPVVMKKDELPKSQKGKNFKMEVKYEGKVYLLEEGIDIHFGAGNKIYISANND